MVDRLFSIPNLFSLTIKYGFVSRKKFKNKDKTNRGEKLFLTREDEEVRRIRMHMK